MFSECPVHVAVMQWAWFIACLACVTPGLAIHEHYHVLSKRIFSTKLNNSYDLFGFSISSMHSGQTSKLLIGAPLADQTGKIYTCKLNNNEVNACISTRNDIIDRYIVKPDYRNLSYWYGATVVGNDESYVGCAPLSIEKEDTKAHADVGTFGNCYRGHDDKEGPTKLTLIPLGTRKLMDGPKNMENFEDRMDSFGWSLFTAPDGSILIGGPAVWVGRVVKWKPGKYFYMSGFNHVEYNFGYAVAAGNFYKQTGLTTAIGSTYGSGKVVFAFDKSPKMKNDSSISGSSVGSMFGAVLCPAYLQPPNSSVEPRVTDLLVGAPTFAQKDGYNLGAVYVVTGTATLDKPTLLSTIIFGTSSDSFFGSAIVSLGDINNDNIDEIAIAAPYESNGRGTVYLYSGADLLKPGARPIQTIVPESKLALKTFGYSLTIVRDYDDNGCKELAIGAPESSKVMLLRCMAAITINLMKFERNLARTNGLDRNENLRVCLNATFKDKPALAKAKIQVVINIEHNDAIFANKRKNETVLILVERKNQTIKTDLFCQNVTMEIHGSRGGYDKKIEYAMKATLLDSPLNKTDFKGSDVILSENSQLSVVDSMRVQECGNVKCVPKLNMTTTFSEESPYEIGSSSSVIVTVKVQNQGDVAYDACVRVNAFGARVSADGCVLYDTGGIVCTPKQLPHKDRRPWIIDDISVDMSQLTNEDDKVNVTVELFNECKTNTVTQNASKEYELFTDPKKVNVFGRTNEGLSNIVNLTRSDIRARKTFDHVYTISNDGPTTWVNVNITVVAKKLDFVTRSVYVQEQKCEAENVTDSEETKFSCLGQRLNSHTAYEATVVMQVLADELDRRIDKGNLFVSSDITVQLGDTFKSGNVTTELRLVKVSVPIWIIVATVILALILLGITFGLLKSCGVLERKNKEELKKVRRSVRRQTIIRQSGIRPDSQSQQPVDPSEAIASQENQKPKKDRRVVVNEE